MSDINTDSERDNIRSKKLTQSSAIIGPFPPIDLDGAACFSSGNEDLDIETRRKKNVPKTSVRSNTKDPISSINKPSVIEGTVQSNLTLEKLNDCIKTILTALAKLDLKIDTLAAEVRNIGLILAAKTTDEEIDKTESQILKAFPLKNETDLAEVEQRLPTDANYKNTMIKDLAIFVQSDVKTTVAKLMHEIMSNALAANYSFHGAHKKKCFDKLKVCDVVSSVIRCRFTKPLVVNKEISDPIKSWLRHAPARLAREEKKTITTNVVNNVETVTDHDKGPNNNRINNKGKQQVNQNDVENSVAVEDSTDKNVANNDDAKSSMPILYKRILRISPQSRMRVSRKDRLIRQLYSLS